MSVHTLARAPVPTPDLPTRWAWHSGPCDALGYRFDVRVEPPDLRRGLEHLLSPFRCGPRRAGPRTHYEVRSTPEGPHPVTLFADGVRLGAGQTATDLSTRLSWHINRSVIDRATDRFVLMHAAAATIGGLTVILPADMESGKTTTVAGLLRNGFDYVTDEAVAIDPATGWVSPFPKLLSLDPGSWALFPECRPDPSLPRGLQWHLAARDLGAAVAGGPVPPPRLVVFPQYVEGAVTEVLPVSRADALQRLVHMTFRFPDHAGRNLRALRSVAASATVARMVIGSLDEAVAAVEGLVSQRILEEL